MATASAKQDVYTWTGQDGRGNPQKGEMPGASQAVVKAQLRKQGIRVNKVSKKGKPMFGPSKPKIKPMDIAIFARQLATMMKAGIPLVQSKIKKAMNDPITVLSIALIVTGILLVKVVPQFAETFSSFGAELPVFTQFVMKISDFAIKWWLYVLGGVGIAGYSFGEAKMRSKKFAEGVERLSLKLPVIGEILEKSALARFTRTLSTTFAAGVPLPEALVSCAGATGNVVYRNALMKVRDDVTSGLQLTYSLRAGQIFPIMILQMVSIGEESGALDAMLDKCATFYEAEVDNAVDGLTSMMEPLIMAVLGVLVGGLMIAMYMPIFQIGSVV